MIMARVKSPGVDGVVRGTFTVKSIDYETRVVTAYDAIPAGTSPGDLVEITEEFIFVGLNRSPDDPHQK